MEYGMKNGNVKASGRFWIYYGAQLFDPKLQPLCISL